MNARSRILKGGLSALLCLCMVIGNFGGVATALAEETLNTNNRIPNWNTAGKNKGPDGKEMGKREAYQVELLAGSDNSELAGSTLRETLNNYQNSYLLDIAAEFCVFLENDFTVLDSDAEGRVAIGGDFYNDTEWGSYAIGVGDYSHVTELEALLKNRTGIATFIVEGEFKRHGSLLKDSAPGKKLLSDAYYESKHKYEYNDQGNNYYSPEHKSSKRLVLNHDVLSYDDATIEAAIGWTPDDNSIPDESNPASWDYRDYPKVDKTQTYITKLIDFDEQFTNLRKYSKWLDEDDNGDDFKITKTVLKKGDDFPEGVRNLWEGDRYARIIDSNDPDYSNRFKYWNADVNVVTIEYLGDASDIKNCVYINLKPGEYDEYFKDATIIVFKNIPTLPNAPRMIVDNDGETDIPWYSSYIIINIPDSGVVHVGNPNNYDGGKITVINGKIISRDYPGQNREYDTTSGNELALDGTQRNNYPGVSSIMYNFSNANKVVLANNFQGTIFAPYANVTDERYEYNYVSKNGYSGEPGHGHLSGAIIAKSFTGYTEFGYRPFNGSAYLRTGKLAIKKTVQGVNPTNQEFSFTVKITPTISGTHHAERVDSSGKKTEESVKLDKNGEVTIKLKDGETFTIDALPDNSTYTVKENTPSGWSSRVEQGKVSDKIEAPETKLVEFVNTYTDDDGSGDGDDSGNGGNTGSEDDSGNTTDNAPKTGDTFSPVLWLGLMAIALMGIFVSSRAVRREKTRH